MQFAPLGNWHRECRTCFRERKKRELEKLQDSNDWLRSDVAQLEAENAQLHAAGGLDQEFIRKLIQWTHPDKHGGSALATEVTARLLAVKGH